MKKDFLIIAMLVLIKFLLPLVLHHPAFELHRDEYLYYQQGQHWDLGFLENPPMIGILGALSSAAGGGIFWIRFWPALFGAFTLLATMGMVKELGGNMYAKVIASIGLMFSAYLRIHFLFQPNFLDIFFWTLSTWCLLRYINTKDRFYLYLLAVSVALGWWSKYSILFFASALVLSILLTRYRVMLKQKDFWLAAGSGLLLILPNILWQWQHHWPLVHHMQELKDTQLKYLNKSDFIREQFLMLLPVFFIWIGGLLWLLMKQPFRIIGYMFLLIIFFVMMGSGKGYYTLGAYPMLLAAGSVWMEGMTKHKMWIRSLVIILIIVLSVPLVPLLVPLTGPEQMAAFNKRWHLEKAGVLTWEDRKSHLLQQDFADMLGWKEMTGKAESFYESLPDTTQSNTIIYCRNYGEAGALKYYSTHQGFSSKIICDNGTFLLWIPDRLWFRHLLFIGEELPATDDEVFQHFDSVQIVDSVSNVYAREKGTKIIFFRNGSDSAWMLARRGLAEMKREFGE